MQPETLTYRYKPKPLIIALASLFFVALAFFMSNEAITNDRGLILNHTIHFTVHEATILYWCIAGMSVALVFIGILAFVAGLLYSHRVTLTHKDIMAPKNGISRRLITVPLSDISRLNVQTLQWQRFLNIYHSTGKLTIQASSLPSKSAFEELCSALAERIPAAHG
jgi:hypothetical protein